MLGQILCVLMDCIRKPTGLNWGLPNSIGMSIHPLEVTGNEIPSLITFSW